MLYYLIFIISDKKYIRCSTTSKVEKDSWIAKGANFDFVHWDTEESGECPIPTYNEQGEEQEWIDSRTYDEKRRAGYKMDSDPTFQTYKGNVEDGGNEETEKAIWSTARASIKTKYPK